MLVLAVAKKVRRTRQLSAGEPGGNIQLPPCYYPWYNCILLCNGMILNSAYSDTYGEFNDIIMTSEQSRVAVHPVQAGKTVKVIAFAGTSVLSIYKIIVIN